MAAPAPRESHGPQPEAGYLTPPASLNLIVAMAAFRESFSRIVKSVVPFSIIMVVWLTTVVVFPTLTQ